MLHVEDILEARARLHELTQATPLRILRTPLLQSPALNQITGTHLEFKAENLQHTGSFKIRGTSNRLRLLREQGSHGVFTVSSGNHGLATAYAAKAFSMKAMILVPGGTPENKKKAITDYGAEVIVEENWKMSYGEASVKFEAMAKEHRLSFINVFEDPQICAGYGSVGLEIVEDCPDVDVVFVPIGAGLFVSAVAAAVKYKKPTARVYGVGPENACCMAKALRLGQPTDIIRDIKDTICDALRAPFTTAYALEQFRDHVDGLITVSEDEAAEATRLIWSKLKQVVEPSAACSFAAILSRKIELPRDLTAVCVLSGGNVDFEKMLPLLTHQT